MPEVRELPVGESHRAAVALLELRPHIGSADEPVSRIDLQRASGYRVVASFEAGHRLRIASYHFAREVA